jgi:hypothetical protein
MQIQQEPQKGYIIISVFYKTGKKWKIKANPVKSTKITFTTRRGLCPEVNISNIPVPIEKEVKYLPLHLGQKPTWKATYKPRGPSSKSN